MDEVPVCLDMTSDRTFDFKGKKQIVIEATNKQNNRITCVMCAYASGRKLRPMIILNEKKFKHTSEVEKQSKKLGISLSYNTSGFTDNHGMKEWINSIWIPQKHRSEVLLVMDRHGAHSNPEAVSLLEESSTRTILIPEG